jgi:outer membrane lipoprotein-sorting protein
MKCLIAVIAGLALSFVSSPSFSAQQVNVGLNDVIATVEKSFKADSSGQLPVNDFTADFFQRTTLAKERREMRGDGQVTVKLATSNSPLMYRFAYYRPYQQEIVSDGKSLWIYHPENREVILSDVSSIYNRPGFNPDRDSAVNFLQGLGRISRDFQINFAGGMYDAAGNYILELNPRRAMLNTRRILIAVSRECVLAYVASKNKPSATTTPAPSRPTYQAPTNRPPFGSQPAFASQQPFGAPQSDLFPILSTTVDDQEGNSTTMEFGNIRINTRLSQSEFSFMIPPGVQVVKPSELNQPR